MSEIAFLRSKLFKELWRGHGDIRNYGISVEGWGFYILKMGDPQPEICFADTEDKWDLVQIGNIVNTLEAVLDRCPDNYLSQWRFVDTGGETQIIIPVSRTEEWDAHIESNGGIVYTDFDSLPEWAYAVDPDEVWGNGFTFESPRINGELIP